jgi:hypothetical protein
LTLTASIVKKYDQIKDVVINDYKARDFRSNDWKGDVQPMDVGGM